MDKTKFGSYIKEARINKNYTQQELANLLFVDVSTVSKWERGVSYPDITLVSDICRVLDISEHELIQSSHDIEYKNMKKDAKKYNKIKKGIFWTLNICYFIAILTCFIVNIAVNHTLSWFFIVLSSLVCAYSFCPTITWIFNKNKNLVFIGSTFTSLFILFLTCSIYTNNYWFMIATLGVSIGYFIVFYPVLFKSIKNKLTGILSKCFLLSYVLGMFILTNLLLVSIYIYASYNLLMALLITGICFVIPISFGILNLFEISKSLNKPLLLSLAGVLVVLILIGLGKSIYLNNTKVVKTYNINEDYNDIKIEGGTADINIYLSNNENKVVYYENNKINIETKVIEDVLIIKQNDNRKFYDMMFNFSDFKIDVYLTNDLIDKLDIEGDTGDVEINKGFNFNHVSISNSTGDIDINNSNISDDLNIDTKTGDIELTNVNCNKLNINVSTGDSELNNVLVTEDFTMNGTTGDLELDGFDASNIYITLSTGDVQGTILSNKIFSVKSSTGSVNVPETYTGGICKITTSTGNVRIRYK